MSTHPDQRYFDAIDATWAPADFKASGPFQLRAGKGGGKRVSAASLAAPTASADDIKSASEAMKEMGQTPLFKRNLGVRWYWTGSNWRNGPLQVAQKFHFGPP